MLTVGDRGTCFTIDLASIHQFANRPDRRHVDSGKSTTVSSLRIIFRPTRAQISLALGPGAIRMKKLTIITDWSPYLPVRWYRQAYRREVREGKTPKISFCPVSAIFPSHSGTRRIFLDPARVDPSLTAAVCPSLLANQAAGFAQPRNAHQTPSTIF